MTDCSRLKEVRNTFNYEEMDEILAAMDVGIYDDNGNLIGIKDGDDY
ncbi:MAG: hypothetical protein K6G19_09295 [Lachnospiraceae bacterium]|nr:hypothetical protein [Lachnospiraceae bacterium]